MDGHLRRRIQTHRSWRSNDVENGRNQAYWHLILVRWANRGPKGVRWSLKNLTCACQMCQSDTTKYNTHVNPFHIMIWWNFSAWVLSATHARVASIIFGIIFRRVFWKMQYPEIVKFWEFRIFAKIWFGSKSAEMTFIFIHCLFRCIHECIYVYTLLVTHSSCCARIRCHVTQMSGDVTCEDDSC